MPRLPTIRVIGSQATSTMLLLLRSSSATSCACVPMFSSDRASVRPGPAVAGGEFRARMTPFGLLVHRVLGDAAQTADQRTVEVSGDFGGRLASRRLVH